MEMSELCNVLVGEKIRYLVVVFCVHCNENPTNVFPEKELRGLSPNFHIHVSVIDLYIPRIGSHIFLQQNRQIMGIYKSLTDT